MKTKKILAALLSSAMVLGTMAVPVFAATTVNTAEELKAEIQSSGEVKLGADLTYGEVIRVPEGVTVTLDLNGHTITTNESSSGKHYYAFNNYGNLTLKDTAGGGSIKARGIQNRKAVTLDNVKIEALDYNGGACVYSYAGSEKVVSNNATLIGSYSCIYAECPLEINGGTYTCYSGVHEDGSYVEGVWSYNINAKNDLKITDGTFTGRHGVVATGSGEAVIDGGSFTVSRKCVFTSHVIYIYGDAEVTVNGGSFIEDNNNGGGTAVSVASDSAQLTINGGTFTGTSGMVYGNSNTVINEGVFNRIQDSDSYGGIGVQHCIGSDSYTEPSTPSFNDKTITVKRNIVTNYVAKIGTTEYETLADAVAAANDGDTITMLSDYTADAKVIVDKGITLDLGGYTVTGTIDFVKGESTVKNGNLTSAGQTVNVNGSLTATPVKLTVASDATINGAYGICAFPATRPTPGNGYSVIDVYGTIESGGIFVSGNIVPSGTATATNGAVINIKNGASVNHSTDQAIAMNGHSYVTVEDGATITGREAIGVKRGVLTVNGGTLTATGANKVPVTANYNGTEESGAVISVTSAYNKYPGKIQVNLKGGTYTSTNGNAVYMGLSSADEFTNGAETNITGGTYTAAAGADAVKVNADGVSAKISGGTFSSDPHDYLASGNSSEKVKLTDSYSVIDTNTLRSQLTTDVVNSDSNNVTIKSAAVNGVYDQVTAKVLPNESTKVFTLNVSGGKYDAQHKEITLTGINFSGAGDVLCGLIITNIPDDVTVTVD